jgi:hypothetical protein
MIQTTAEIAAAAIEKKETIHICVDEGGGLRIDGSLAA